MPDKSEISELPTIEGIFDSLDRWRHLPAYQLERLAGVFFALFLPEVLEKVLKVKIKRPLIPEFPIRKNNEDGYLSKKVDYFALSEDHKYAFLIELKTDMNSINKKQNKKQIRFLEHTAEKEVFQIVKDVLETCSKTDLKAKYVHLLNELSHLGLVNHKGGKEKCIREELDELHRNAIPLEGRKDRNSNQGKVFEKVLGKLVPADISPEVRVVYIQPIPENGDSSSIPCGWPRIYFDCFADHVEERGPIGRQFAGSLRRWKEPAGSCPPKPWIAHASPSPPT